MRMAGEQTGAEPRKLLHQYYTTLLESFGPQGWWPARTRWEVICGAILTQNTTWVNAARAIKNLRVAGALPRKKMLTVPLEELEALIRPAGFFRQKAKALHNIAHWIEREHGGSLDALFAQDAGHMQVRGSSWRSKASAPKPPTPFCSIPGGIRCLWPMPTPAAFSLAARLACGIRRTMIHSAGDSCIGICRREERLFNEFHALIVETAKRYCHRNVMRTVRNARSVRC
jgi:endonuclease-3 related protein